MLKKLLITTILLIAIIGCGQENPIVRYEPDEDIIIQAAIIKIPIIETEIPIPSIDEDHKITIEPAPGSKIAWNDKITIIFPDYTVLVKTIEIDINGQKLSTRERESTDPHRTWSTNLPIPKTHPKDKPIKLTIEYTWVHITKEWDTEKEKYKETAEWTDKVTCLYFIGVPDNTPPLIESGSILNPRGPDKGPYPQWIKEIDGKTDIPTNTETIEFTFNEEIAEPNYIRITDNTGTDLEWERRIKGRTAKLRQITPEYRRRMQEKYGASITEITPQGEIIIRKEESNLMLSTPLAPNTEYKIYIEVTDRSQNSNDITITFKTK